MLRTAVALGLLALAAAGEPPTPALPILALPIPGACVSSPFGMRQGQMHRGTDIPAPAGAWVLAAAPGTIVAIRRINASGLEVELRHEGGIRTRYAHLGTVTPALAEGKRQVAAGERLGRVGRTGITRGTHLHFELTIDDKLTDPAPILGILPCRRAAD